MMVSESNERFAKSLALILLIPSLILTSPAFAEEVLKIGGTGCALGSMELAAKGFEKSNQGIKVIVFHPSLGSSGGIKAVLTGVIGIGLSGRPLKEEERELGLSSIIYAKTPLIFVTKKDVNIQGVSTGEIVKIYRGETGTWPDGRRIRLVLRPRTEADTLIVKKISPEMNDAVDSALSRKGMSVAMTDQECLDLLENAPGGFGFTTLTQTLTEKRPLKILSLNGVPPCIKTVTDGSYPLYKELYWVTKTKPSALAQKFIDFVRSSEGRKILEESGNLVMMGKSGQ
jgi:phosphate transport system substrate-binding protein